MLALVADTLTENVFFLVENEQLQTIEAKFGVKVRKLVVLAIDNASFLNE